MAERTDFFFDNSPVFKLGPGADGRRRARVRAVRFSRRRSAAAGPGDRSISKAASPPSRRRSARAACVLYGPEILQRAQPHGTFKLLFNALYASAASSQ